MVFNTLQLNKSKPNSDQRVKRELPMVFKQTVYNSIVNDIIKNNMKLVLEFVLCILKSNSNRT